MKDKRNNRSMIIQVPQSGCDISTLRNACQRGTILPVRIELLGQSFIINHRIVRIREINRSDIDNRLHMDITPMYQILLEEDEERQKVK